MYKKLRRDGSRLSFLIIKHFFYAVIMQEHAFFCKLLYLSDIGQHPPIPLFCLYMQLLPCEIARTPLNINKVIIPFFPIIPPLPKQISAFPAEYIQSGLFTYLSQHSGMGILSRHNSAAGHFPPARSP